MKFKALTTIVSLIILSSLLYLGGCDQSLTDRTVVATVGEREIYLEEIHGFFDRAGVRFKTADYEYEVKRDFLDSLINQNLLILGAYDYNLENHDEVNRVVEGEKIKFLLDVLFEQKIISKSIPTDAEVEDWYNRMGEELKASHVLVSSPDTAEIVLQKLKDGVPFEELALKYSIDPTVKRNQGSLDWFTWGIMVDNFQDAVFKMQPGEISAPVKTDYGYHIIKLIERRAIGHRPSFAESKDNTKGMIIERRKRNLMLKFRDELRQRFPITIQKPTCTFVLNKLEFLYPETIGTMPRWRNNVDPAQLDQNEKDLVLGRYDGGQLTLGEYLGNLRRVSPDRRPDFDHYDSLADAIFQMSFMDILAQEAKREGLDESPIYLRKVKYFRELAMADIVRNDSIPSQSDIFEDEILEYFNSHPKEFTKPMRFKILEIQVEDEQQAKKFKRKIRTEREFRDIAARETMRPGKRLVEGDLGIILRDQYPFLFEAAEKVKEGQIGGPVKVARRYSIVWVLQRLEPVLQEFENVKQFIVDLVTKEKGDRLFETWIASKRDATDITIDEDILRQSIDKSKYLTQDDAGDQETDSLSQPSDSASTG